MATADEMTAQPHEEPEVVAEPATTTLEWHASVSTRPIGFGPHSEATVVDWDGQGRADLLVTAGPSLGRRSARLYRQTSPSGVFPPQYDAGTPVDGLAGLRCVSALPVGVSFNLVGFDASGLVLLKNMGTPGNPQFESRASLGFGPDLGVQGAQVAQLVAIDWDGDKLTDLLVGLNDMTGYWPEELPVELQIGFNQMAGHPGYDHVGKWRGQAPVGRIRWLKNVGSAETPAFELQDELVPETGSLNLDVQPAGLAVAWGGGTALELMTADRHGTVQLYRNFGGQRPPVLLDPRKLMSAGKPLQLPDDRTTLIAADLDGDRRVELIYGTADGRIFAIHAASGRDNAQAPVVLEGAAGDLHLGGGVVATAVDLDQNGGLDFVVGDAAGRIWWIKDAGEGATRQYTAPVELEGSGVPFRLDPGPDGRLLGPAAPMLGHACPAVADWNSNGRLDIILSGAGGDVLWLKNDGAATDPRFALPVPFLVNNAPLFTPPRVRPGIARWLNTENFDLIALDLQGFLCVYGGDASNNLAPPTAIVDTLGRLIRLDGAYGQNGQASLWAGDFTGSGQPDILVGVPRGGRHVIAGLLGKPVESLDDVSTVLLLENRGHNTVLPRMITRADGAPIVVGVAGCSPSGVGSGGLVIVGDDGVVQHFSRSDIRW